MLYLFLVGSEISFRYFGFMVFQVQLSKSVDAVPLTRDYLFDAEKGIRARAADDREMQAALAPLQL